MKRPFKRISSEAVVHKRYLNDIVLKKNRISAKKFIVIGRAILNTVIKNQIILIKNVPLSVPLIIILFREDISSYIVPINRNIRGLTKP